MESAGDAAEKGRAGSRARLLAARARGLARRALYPPTCAACGAATEADWALCGPCWREAGFLAGSLVCDACGVPLPDWMGFETAAALFTQALTAWHLLHTVSRTRSGDVVLIHAIGGGVGLYLTQLAKAAGATVIGTVGTAGKELRAQEYGADLVINREEQDFVEAVMSFTGGRGVDKVIDSTGASILERSFGTIRRLGHVVSYGEAEGRPFETLWQRLVEKSYHLRLISSGRHDLATSGSWSGF